MPHPVGVCWDAQRDSGLRIFVVGWRFRRGGAPWRVACRAGLRGFDASRAEGALAVQAHELRVIIGAHGCFIMVAA
eukprot:9337861-Alexandrium_andersonii.AAC.1